MAELLPGEILPPLSVVGWVIVPVPESCPPLSTSPLPLALLPSTEPVGSLSKSVPLLTNVPPPKELAALLRTSVPLPVLVRPPEPLDSAAQGQWARVRLDGIDALRRSGQWCERRFPSR